MSHVLAFAAISAVVICTPGPDTALIVRNTLFGGRANGVRTAAGIGTGIATWTLAASAGIAAIVAASHPLLAAIRVAGAAYLVWLGIQSFRGHAREQIVQRPGSGYRQGLLSNLGNPKIAIFFTSFLPQFTPAKEASFGSLVLLGVVFCTIGLTWLTLYTLAIARVGDFLRRPRARRILEGVTGVVLVGFGIRLAAEHR